MKKLAVLCLVLILMLSFAMAACAQDDPLNYSFPEGTKMSFGSVRGTLPTYTAPSFSAYRMAGGKAAAGLHYQVITFYARMDEWALISYENSQHVFHMGWADTGALSYSVLKTLPAKDPLSSASLNAKLNGTTPIWDYYDIYQDPVTTLSEGTPLVYLCCRQDDISGLLAYVQVDTPLGLIRGFVPYNLMTFE